MPSRRPGRPKAPLPPANHPLTRRVRHLVDEAHLGNLREAAGHTGVSYGTLRDLYRGRTIEPGLTTLAAVAQAYGLPVDWFLGDDGTAEPVLAIETTLPPDPEFRRGREGRRFRIPLAAWPLAGLVLDLERELQQRPALASRPLIGPLRDPELVRQQIVVFLIGPVLEAQRRGLVTVFGADPPWPGAERPSPARRREWIGTLRRLGEFWREVLADLLPEAAG